MESLPFRYKKPADWELLSDLAEQHPVPLIGNGDILTHYEVGQPPCCGGVSLLGPDICHSTLVGRLTGNHHCR